jgi:4-hydroxy-3-methylbut-2-enyl diphosphate reductase
LEGFLEIAKIIESRMQGEAKFEFFDTICRQVSNRVPNIKEFARQHDIIFFIAGEKSSNGKVLFAECKKINPNSYLIHTPEEVDLSLISHDVSLVICGATSSLSGRWRRGKLNTIENLSSPIEKAAF